MNNSIYPCLWCDNNASDVAIFYTNVFDGSLIESENPVTVMMSLYGQKLLLLNGGPMFRKNASVSLMVVAESEEEIQRYWERLSEGGRVLMELGSYPWSEKYGWVKDKYDTTWQLYLGKKSNDIQRLVPTLMFVGKNNGRAADAMDFYTTVFPHSKIGGVLRYKDGGEPDVPDNIQHANFDINHYTLFCLDTSIDHPFNFNEAISLVVECENQKEIDHYWDALSAQGEESQCGWLKDRFGLSWQIVPKNIGSLLMGGTPEENKHAMDALMGMKKIVIDGLKGQ